MLWMTSTFRSDSSRSGWRSSESLPSYRSQRRTRWCLDAHPSSKIWRQQHQTRKHQLSCRSLFDLAQDLAPCSSPCQPSACFLSLHSKSRLSDSWHFFPDCLILSSVSPVLLEDTDFFISVAALPQDSSSLPSELSLLFPVTSSSLSVQRSLPPKFSLASQCGKKNKKRWGNRQKLAIFFIQNLTIFSNKPIQFHFLNCFCNVQKRLKWIITVWL